MLIDFCLNFELTTQQRETFDKNAEAPPHVEEPDAGAQLQLQREVAQARAALQAAAAAGTEPPRPKAAFFLFVAGQRAEGRPPEAIQPAWLALSAVERGIFDHAAVELRREYDEELGRFKAARARRRAQEVPGLSC